MTDEPSSERVRIHICVSCVLMVWLEEVGIPETVSSLYISIRGCWSVALWVFFCFKFGEYAQFS